MGTRFPSVFDSAKADLVKEVGLVSRVVMTEDGVDREVLNELLQEAPPLEIVDRARFRMLLASYVSLDQIDNTCSLLEDWARLMQLEVQVRGIDAIQEVALPYANLVLRDSYTHRHLTILSIILGETWLHGEALQEWFRETTN